ncbi:MAG: PEP/pyruvate-binding domain-containing protein, partial [Hyphomonadaceae bacterium]
MSEARRYVLTGEAAISTADAGGKGAALAKLAATFPVPAFFVIAAEAFDESGLLPDARESVNAGITRLGRGGRFAVRSSGREEDGADSAHAGQFETELNVSADDVTAAAHRVWRSGFSETLAAYRQAKGLSGAPQPPAVVVQVMVEAIAAGVAFSVDPVTGDRSVVVVSAIAGLADKLVGGEADGDSYRVGADGATREAERVGDEFVLSEPQRAEVAAMARKAAAHFGSPQDIEWAFDTAGLHMLQSRPITTLAQAASGDETIWDNSNIVESYPGVTSPLTFSFARYVYSHVYQAFARLMGVRGAVVDEHRAVFENMLGRVDGRVYYNLLNWYRGLALFPGFKANRAFMEGMMGVSEALPQEMADRIAPPSTSGGEKFIDNMKFMRVGFGLIWHEITIKTTIREFYARLNTALARPDTEIDAMQAQDLAAEYRLLERQLLAQWDAPLVNDFLCMIAFGAAQKSMTNWAGDDGLAFLTSMLIGQGDIVSAEPAKMIRGMGAMVRSRPEVVARLSAGELAAIDALPELRAAFDRYIAKFGDRCTQELKLESRTLHEDPVQVLKAIAAAAVTREGVKAEEAP